MEQYIPLNYSTLQVYRILHGISVTLDYMDQKIPSMKSYYIQVSCRTECGRQVQ